MRLSGLQWLCDISTIMMGLAAMLLNIMDVGGGVALGDCESSSNVTNSTASPPT